MQRVLAQLFDGHDEGRQFTSLIEEWADHDLLDFASTLRPRTVESSTHQTRYVRPESPAQRTAGGRADKAKPARYRLHAFRMPKTAFDHCVTAGKHGRFAHASDERRPVRTLSRSGSNKSSWLFPIRYLGRTVGSSRPSESSVRCAGENRPFQPLGTEEIFDDPTR